ncbi:hypothetical protein [Klebsiella michiganensis]|uniref:hypothetical protein n=1 Tax=Klebsiella michiganensis TaxID=1134687 RepID=UPI00166B0172|nr:hypothetical protein [Klebsiella michiganensis]MBD0989798.1 hypothetical protein [Klebsiella michiganensis]MDM4525283.1 hypothetical protein [Klebsiella michiganensis]MDM4540501.1 hypothetical protein [Klebsiella michiganensis]HBK4599652.1 hypothetical protein [Klebsiella michiganensis]HBK4633410.1 hypothetical protein [Klebsiella michiganensis]
MSEPITSTAEIVSSSGFTLKDYMYAAGVCISVFSAGVAWVSVRRTLKRDLNSLGDSEIKIFELVSKAESEVVKFNVKIKREIDSKGSEFEFSNADRIELDCLVESLLNIYDIACQRYQDSKIDKRRFVKTYKARIGQLFSNSLYKPYLSSNDFQYSALKNTHRQLNDLEMKGDDAVVNIDESPEQKIMSPKGQGNVRLLINSIALLMLAMVFILDKSDIQSKGAWISVINSTCVASIYLLFIYYRYASFPENQKKLKAKVDSFANFLALIAIVITFITVVVTERANSLYVVLAENGGASILFGVIIGVLSSRVLFPFWDLYSKYRKV